MSMFPHVVTLYNTISEEDPTQGFKPVLTNYITVLDGVLLDAVKGVNVSQSGLENADSVILYIPANVNATDGITGEKKQYVGPIEFWRSDDKSHLWTIKPGKDCFFIKGRAIHPEWTVQTIEAAYDDVYDVTKSDFKDYGGDMRHWEVGGA